MRQVNLISLLLLAQRKANLSFAKMQIIDYSLVNSIPAALENSYSGGQFDAILDTVGSRELFLRCPKYLKPEGVFINVGDGSEGRLSLILNTLQNVLQPSILGGVPRRYMTFSAPLNGQNAAYLGNLASKGKLMVFIDSTFSLEDVINVRFRDDRGFHVSILTQPQGIQTLQERSSSRQSCH